MWLLHFLPDSLLLWVVNIACILGLGMTILGFFFGWVPFVSRYKTPFQIFGIIILTVGVYWKGGYSTEMEWRERVAEVEKKVAVAEAKAKQANTKVQEKIVTKIVKIKEKAEKAKIIIQEKREVINADCRLNDEAIDAYNYSIIKEKK